MIRLRSSETCVPERPQCSVCRRLLDYWLVVRSVTPSDNAISLHLPIQGHARPLERLGGFAHIPIGGEESREQAVPLALGQTGNLLDLPVELLWQVYKGNLPRGEVVMKLASIRFFSSRTLPGQS